MISKEQIAHDLTMIYLENKYEIHVTGELYISGDSGNGTISTEHFPSVSEPDYIKVKTGEKGMFGLSKNKKSAQETRLILYLQKWFRTITMRIRIFIDSCVNRMRQVIKSKQEIKRKRELTDQSKSVSSLIMNNEKVLPNRCHAKGCYQKPAFLQNIKHNFLPFIR